MLFDLQILPNYLHQFSLVWEDQFHIQDRTFLTVFLFINFSNDLSL